MSLPSSCHDERAASASGRDLLELAATLARRAATAVMDIRERGITINRKPDASPVTAADRAADELIVSGLRAATPDMPVISEESLDRPAGSTSLGAECCWLVDPLDGTKEFCAGLDEFTVNIGLVKAGRPCLGVVAAPATGELFGGHAGEGAWKEDAAGRRHAIRVRPVPSEGALVMVSRSHCDEAWLDSFLTGRKIAQLVRIGSSLKLCRIAEGEADLYPRLGPTMEWDTAAAQAVLEAAGGAVRNLDGSPLRYGKPGLTNPPFVGCGL